MKIGVPKEIKSQENRIGLTPESVKVLTFSGHEVLIENNGGFEAGFDNDQYIKAGAKIINKAEDIFHDAEIINLFLHHVYRRYLQDIFLTLQNILYANLVYLSPKENPILVLLS